MFAHESVALASTGPVLAFSAHREGPRCRRGRIAARLRAADQRRPELDQCGAAVVLHRAVRAAGAVQRRLDRSAAWRDRDDGGWRLVAGYVVIVSLVSAVAAY